LTVRETPLAELLDGQRNASRLKGRTPKRATSYPSHLRASREYHTRNEAIFSKTTLIQKSNILRDVHLDGRSKIPFDRNGLKIKQKTPNDFEVGTAFLNRNLEQIRSWQGERIEPPKSRRKAKVEKRQAIGKCRIVDPPKLRTRRKGDLRKRAASSETIRAKPSHSGRDANRFKRGIVRPGPLLNAPEAAVWAKGDR
jgi:hypothetical protein